MAPRKITSLSVFVFFLFLELFLSSAFAWEQWYCFKWPDKQMTMSLGALGAAQIDEEPWTSIAITAKNAWFLSCDPDADFVWNTNANACSTRLDGSSCTGFAALGDCTGTGTKLLGQTRITTVNGCDFVEIDVEINSQCVDSGWYNSNRALGVLAHEYGHVIGLDHSELNSALMYPYFSDSILMPTQDDCAGFYQIYLSQPPVKANNPSPSNNSTEIPINTSISWLNGGGATSYDIYFGTDSTPDAEDFKLNQNGQTFDPGPLSYSTIYYWRIDAINQDGTTPGDVWSFTTQSEHALTITSFSPLPVAWVGHSYSAMLTAAGGTTPYSWSVASGNLSEGLSLSPSTGEIHGTPSRADNYTFTVQVTDSVGRTAQKIFNLIVHAPGSLALTPAGGLSASGTPGGPFSPASIRFTLYNPGATSINWTADNTQGWVTLSGAGGTLRAGESDSIIVSINSNANSLTASQTPYTDTVSFTNTTNGNGNDTRSVSLAIIRPSSINMAPIHFLLLSELDEEYLYVCDSGAKVVHQLSVEGTYKKRIGTGLLENAFSCLIDSQNNLLVGDGSEFKIFSNHTLIGSFGGGYFKNGGAVFAAVDPNGNIYAANYKWGTIEVFSKEYEHTNTIDIKNWLGDESNGGEEGPVGIAYDPSDGSLIFTTVWAPSGDTGNYKITRSGSLIRMFGPSNNNQFDCKIVPSGTVYIKDTTPHTAAVTLFDSEGNFIQNWVPVGNNPFGLAFDSKERIYVVVDPKRIEVYEGPHASTPIRTITNPNFQSCGGMDVGR